MMTVKELKTEMPMALGIDIGAATTRIALLDPRRPMPEIVRNELSSEATSTAVSYPVNEARCYGESAVSKQITKPDDTVIDLAQWLFGTARSNAMELPPSIAAAGMSEAPEEEGLCMRRIGDGDRHPVQLAAYFIKSILKFVPGNVGNYPVCVALPTAAPVSAATALRQACTLAGIPKEHTIIAPSDEAMAVYFHHMQYANLDEEKPTIVTILDVGQSCVSACAIAVTRHTIRKLAVESLRIGSGFLDGALCSHVYDEMQKKFGKPMLQGDVKSFRRILRECRKAKEILSTVEETRLQLEALQGHIDISVTISRSKLEELARPFCNELRHMMTALKKATAASLASDAAAAMHETRVEAIGGGWRSAFVGGVAREVLGAARLGVSLDASLAIAEGSAILALICGQQRRAFGAAAKDAEEAAKDSEAAAPADAGEELYESHRVALDNFAVAMPGSPIASPLSEQEESDMATWASVEATMAATDAAIYARLSAVNQLDAFVLQTLQTIDECDAAAARKESAREYLYALDSYVQNDCEKAEKGAILAKLGEARAHVAEVFPEVEAHHAKVRAEEKRKEEELIRLSQEEKKDDDSNLKTDPQRLRAAQKRREQGAALFKQEHWQEAQTRFVQALATLGELYDVSGEETRKARDEIVLSCHLNIASCSVKLGLWRNAINNCTSALELSPEHPKAYFRRGQAYAASKEYQEAVHDLEQAARLSNNDAAVVAELNAAKKNLDAQKAKEKKMYAKMFS